MAYFRVKMADFREKWQILEKNWHILEKLAKIREKMAKIRENWHFLEKKVATFAFLNNMIYENKKNNTIYEKYHKS